MYSGTVTEQDGKDLGSRVLRIVAALEAERDADQNRDRLEQLARDGQLDAVLAEADRAYMAESRVASLQAELKKAQAELEKLARVDEARDRSIKSIREYNYTLESENETLTDELRQLREWQREAMKALRPFADWASGYPGDELGGRILLLRGAKSVEVGHFRRAARIVEQADHLAEAGKMVERSPANDAENIAKNDTTPNQEPDPVTAPMQSHAAKAPAHGTVHQDFFQSIDKLRERWSLQERLTRAEANLSAAVEENQRLQSLCEQLHDLA